MRKKTDIKFKRGIAMIELIFALVIMGIVLMSTPMLIHQSIRSANIALQQEAIAAASSQVSIVLSMHWDENNSNIAVGTSPILDTKRAVTPNTFDFNSGDILGLKGTASGDRVSGRVTSSGGVYDVSISFAKDSGEDNYTVFDDVDDFNNSDLGLMVFNTQNTTADIGDYVDTTLNMHTQINYTEDRPSGNILDTTTKINKLGMTTITNTDLGVPSNIKFITINLTSTSGIEELDKNITINAFSCNIGTFIPQGDTEL